MTRTASKTDAETRESEEGRMDHKVFTLSGVEVKADEGAAVGEFSGYLSVYGNVDSQGEVVDKGAFARSLDHQKQTGDPVPCLVLHDRDSLPVGGLWLSEDEHGLKVKGELVLETERGREAYFAIKRKLVRGLSIGFRTIKDAWEKGTRHLKEVELLEGSIVTWPANKLARIGAVKSDGSAVSPEDARVAFKRAVVAAVAEKDIDGAFGIVTLLAQTLREALLSAIPDGNQSQALWESLYEVRSTCEAIINMLYAFGKPEEVGESMAALLVEAEAKAKERRVLEGAALRKVRAALATLKSLLDAVEDSDDGKGADSLDEHSAGVSELAVALASLKAFNESRRLNHA